MVYLLCSSRPLRLCRHLRSFPGDSWRPAGPRRRRCPVGERHNSEPSRPALWAGNPTPRSSRGNLHSRSNPRGHFSPRSSGPICVCGCVQLFAALPRPRQEAGSSSTFQSDTPAESQLWDICINKKVSGVKEHKTEVKQERRETRYSQKKKARTLPKNPLFPEMEVTVNMTKITEEFYYSGDNKQDREHPQGPSLPLSIWNTVEPVCRQKCEQMFVNV